MKARSLKILFHLLKSTRAQTAGVAQFKFALEKKQFHFYSHNTIVVVVEIKFHLVVKVRADEYI